jgi:hypothetical protein
VLVVLQGMDTSGKDGVVRHVFGPLDAQGVTVTNFKKPTLTELNRDYLWRVHHEVPPRGTIGVFNRSHYEDVLVVRVHGWVPRSTGRRAALPADQRLRTLSQRERRHHPQVLPPPLEGRAEEPAAEPPRRPDQALEVRAWRHRGAQAVAGSTSTPTRSCLARCSTAHGRRGMSCPPIASGCAMPPSPASCASTLEGLDLHYPDPPEGLEGISID